MPGYPRSQSFARRARARTLDRHDGTPVDIIRVRAEPDLASVVELLHEYAASIGVDPEYQKFSAEVATLPGQRTVTDTRNCTSRGSEFSFSRCLCIGASHAFGTVASLAGAVSLMADSHRRGIATVKPL